MRRLFFLLPLLLLTGILSAQDTTPKYRLHVPTPKEYLNTLQEIVKNPHDSTPIETALLEVNYRYVQSHNISFEDLNTFYDFFTEQLEMQASVRSQWLQTLLDLWFHEHTVDFENQSHFTVGSHPVSMVPMALARYGENTKYYRLDVYTNDQYAESFIIQIVNRQYEFLPVPLSPLKIDQELLFTTEYLPFDENKTRIVKLWAFITVGENNNDRQTGSLNVLAWYAGKFEVLAQIPYQEAPASQHVADSNGWNIVNTDDDQEDEIRYYKQFTDNWTCEWTAITTYDYQWEKNAYIASQQGAYFPNTFGCLMRQAEAAMWTHDYNSAIDFYERAFKAQQADVDEDNLKPYAQVRLALAYTLTYQPDKAAAIVDRIGNTDNKFANAFRQAYAKNSEPIPLCQSIYDFASNKPNLAPFMAGMVQDSDGAFYRSQMYYYQNLPFHIENAVCDLATLINQALANTRFTSDKSPVDQLKVLGLKTSHSLSDDLDMDGQKEWLVWTSWGIDPIFFHPDGKTYQVSRLKGSSDPAFREADLRAPDNDNRYAVITLPDNAGRALVNVDMGYDSYGAAICGGCGGGPSIDCSMTDYPEDQRTLGDLSLWQVNSGTLTPLFFSEYCGKSSVESIFPNGTHELHASKETWYAESGAYIIPATYYWDSATKTYSLPPQPSDTPSPTETPYSPPLNQTYNLYTIQTALAQNQFNDVLTMTTALIDQPGDDYTKQLHPAYQYDRALALEALNRPDEALADYIAIYTTAPDSAWGKLAALHLEPINP